MRQAIALAVLQATPVSSMVPWGERVIPQRNEAFLFKSLFQGIWNLGLLLLGNCRLSESSGHTYSSPEKTWRIAFTVSRILHEINFFLVVVKFSRNLKCLNISLHETNKSKFTSNFHNWHVFGVIKRDNSDPLQEKYIII